MNEERMSVSIPPAGAALALVSGMGVDVAKSLDRIVKQQKKRHEGPALPVAPSLGISRNDPCPCGSGKKYKSCCMREAHQL
jgi:uncharacterized protein YecA (UPF0149 family)